jgi:hypothetical protein
MRATENLTARAFRQNGGYAGPSRAPSRAPTLGSTQQFWSLNSLSWPPTSTGYTDVNATCMGIGQHCYLFEDNNTPASYAKYPASAWAEITAAFDNDIYAKNIATFGSEPNPGVDGESKVYILFTYNVNAQRASGYFDSTNEMSVAEVAALGSTYKTNVKEILFMQVPTSTDTWAGLKHHVFGVMAHEFLHMIVYNQHVMLGGAQDNEEDWINEGLAQVAQDETGYGYQYGTLSFLMQPFLSDPEGYSLTNFQFSLGQYGMAYMYIRYLADQGYNLKNLTSTTRTGVANVEAVTGKDFKETFRDWAVALYVSNTDLSTDPKYHYTSINLRTTQADGTSLNGAFPYTTRSPLTNFDASNSLRGSGVRIAKITGGNGGTVDFEMKSTGGGNLDVTIIRK